MTDPATIKIEVPVEELWETAKALIAERVLGFHRELDSETGEWVWSGMSLDETGHIGPVTIDELPDVMGDLRMAMTLVGRVCQAGTEKGIRSMLVFDTSQAQGPWICQYAENNEAGQLVNLPHTRIAASHVALAIVMSTLAYYRVAPEQHHRLYFPARYIEAGAPAREEPSAGKIILP